MVSYRLVEENDEYDIYWYFPQGVEEYGHGVIVVDKHKEEVSIAQLAPADFTRVLSPDELNEIRNSVNRMRKEDGELELTEEEWPSAMEDVNITYYGDHAISKIIEGYHSGNVLKNGMAAWY